MKRIALFLLCFKMVTLSGLPIGNPGEASLLCEGVFFGDSSYFSLRAGYRGDFVFDRHLEIGSGNHPDLDTVGIYTNAGLVTLNLLNRADLFATVGATFFDLESNCSAFSPQFIGVPFSGQLLRFETTTDFSWSVGGRLTLLDWCNVLVGIEGEYFQTCPKIRKTFFSEQIVGNIDGPVRLEYEEWQVGVGIAYRYLLCTSRLAVVPYAAVKWAEAKSSLNDTQVGFTFTPSSSVSLTLHDFENKKDIGYALGLTLSFLEGVTLNVEGRFLDEKAVSVNGQVRF